jgi:hypothetical protein
MFKHMNMKANYAKEIPAAWKNISNVFTAEVVLGEGRKLGQENCAVEPEPGNAEYRQVNGAVLPS